MSKELEALKVLKYMNETNCWFEFDFSSIESALKRKIELEKAFHSLSKEDEKTKKLLSKEIEKNRTLDIIISKRVNIELLGKCKDAAGYNQSIQHLPNCAFLRAEEFKAIKSLL